MAMTSPYIALTISTISRGVEKNQRIVLHNKTFVFLTLTPLLINGSRAHV